MILGLIGKKIGMTRIFDVLGNSIPVTLINIPYNFLIKTENYDVFFFFKICCGFKKYHKVNKCVFGYYIKQNSNFFGYIIKNLKINFFDFKNFFHGDIIPLNIFYINQYVDVISLTIGKGFCGVMKSYGFKCGGASHGTSKVHRKLGSTGMSQDPGRVFAGKKMSGRLGYKKNTIQKLKIINIDFNYNVIYLKGCVSGFKNSNIYIKPFIK